jgi:hypothetical protein
MHSRWFPAGLILDLEALLLNVRSNLDIKTKIWHGSFLIKNTFTDE